MTKIPLSAMDWNFDAVLDGELVACCHWEYARESAFLREFKKQWDSWDGSDRCPDEVAKGINRIEQASPQAFVRLEALLACPSFPSAWQTLAQRERDSLVHVDMVLPPPFERNGSVTEAERLLEEARERVREFRAAEEKVHQEYPGYGEGTLRRMRKWPEFDQRCSILWDDGTESTIIQIGWEHYTNEQIIKAFRNWVKANRPEKIRPPSGKGHKPKDWRANLTRLAVMRLLAQFTPLAIIDPRRNGFPAVWKTKQFAGRKWGDPTKWHDARREAGLLFHRLFPFLSKAEMPVSWQRPAPGK